MSVMENIFKDRRLPASAKGAASPATGQEAIEADGALHGFGNFAPASDAADWLRRAGV